MFLRGPTTTTSSPKLYSPDEQKPNGKEFFQKTSGVPKGIVAWGMDVQVYKQRIKALWRRDPLEAYACTEFGSIAYQAWGEKGGACPSFRIARSGELPPWRTIACGDKIRPTTQRPSCSTRSSRENTSPLLRVRGSGLRQVVLIDLISSHSR